MGSDLVDWYWVCCLETIVIIIIIFNFRPRVAHNVPNCVVKMRWAANGQHSSTVAIQLSMAIQCIFVGSGRWETRPSRRHVICSKILCIDSITGQCICLWSGKWRCYKCVSTIVQASVGANDYGERGHQTIKLSNEQSIIISQEYHSSNGYGYTLV